MPMLPERMAEIKFTTYDGKEVIFRRCGYYFDLFADVDGRVIRIQEPNRRMINDGTAAISYDGATLTVKHLVADAWIPAWEEKSPHLDCVDGNEKNTAANNLRPSTSKKKGAKRDNLPLRVFKAMELALHCRNVKLAALESGLTVEDVVFGFCRYMPQVLRKDSPYRFVGMPKTIDRIGLPKDIARMVRLGEISIKAVSEEE